MQHNPNPIRDESSAGAWLQKSSDVAKANRFVETEDIGLRQDPRGIGLFLKKRFGGGSTRSKLACREMLITSISQDYFFAVPAPAGGSATTDAVPEQVAKPTNARGDATNPNSRTVQLQATPSVNIVQTLTPSYTVGQRVWVLSGIDDIPDQRLEISPNREWVDPLVIVCARVNGVDKQIYVRGSAPF